MLLTACIMTCNELEPLKRCLASIKGHVDAYSIGVDDKTTDGTYEWLIQNSYHPYKFTFHDFGQARNLCIERSRTPWYFVIDSDEIIIEEHACQMRSLCTSTTDVDAFIMYRKHWLDLEMTRPYLHFPQDDRHIRLARNYVRMAGAVHEQFINYRNARICELAIQHFNMYYRDGSVGC